MGRPPGTAPWPRAATPHVPPPRLPAPVPRSPATPPESRCAIRRNRRASLSRRLFTTRRRVRRSASAGEAVVARGALSDAEVRRALAQEERAAAADRATLRAIRTPAPGGFSVSGDGTIPIPNDVPEVIR